IFWACPLRYFWARCPACCPLLPLGGTALVWMPVALYLLLSGAVAKGLILIAIGAGLVGLMDNLLQPFLVCGRAHLPVLPLYLATFGALAYFGFLGLFLGPFLLAVDHAML